MLINNSLNNNLQMVATNSRHFGNKAAVKADDNISGSFADALKNVLGNVNNLQVDSEKLTQKMVYEPESVDIHTVMIANQKAEVALSLTKAVRDEAIKAYRELTNLR